MLSKNELRALSGISNGADDVQVLSGVLDLSKPQTYKVVRSLGEKALAHLDHGNLLIEKKTHIAILLEILNASPDSYIVLSDSGLEIIRMLIVPRTVSEISSATGLHQTTITRKIDKMRRMGMIRKKGSAYSINGDLWPKLLHLARSYDEYASHIDTRVPFGAEIYHLSKDVAVFSTDRTLKNTRTAFSRYAEHGMNIHPGTNYYCSADGADIRDVFVHSLYVAEKEKSWRNKMLALIFYVMHKNELKDIAHPVVDDMHTILNGGSAEGWAPLDEMNDRAKIYGVNLFDI